jgi:sugar phosphate isomerase/epimerase
LPTDPDAPWTFAVVGRGHDAAWWGTFLAALDARGVDSVSIEHEDPTVSPASGVAVAADILRRAVAPVVEHAR